MNILLLLAVAIIAVFTVMGFKVGLVRRVVEFVGLVLSFLLATNLASRWSEPLAGATGLEERIAVYIAWIILFLLGLVATRMAAWFISKTIHISILGWLDRLGGALFGLLTGALLTSVILIALTQLLPDGETLREEFTEHPVARVIYNAAPAVYDTFQKLGGDEENLWEKIREKLDTVSDKAAERLSADSFPATPSSLEPRPHRWG
ncbi:MAG: CvpA family protein [bacterium]